MLSAVQYLFYALRRLVARAAHVKANARQVRVGERTRYLIVVHAKHGYV